MVNAENKNKNTEEQIFDAAREVFVEKGFDGTRMEEIAKRGGINKALLHYYYRTKEKLFSAILIKVFSEVVPTLTRFLEQDKPIIEKLSFFIDLYISTLQKNPFIPMFIIQTVHRHPQIVKDAFKQLMASNNHPFLKFKELVNREIDANTIKPIKAEHLLVNMLAMCIFPFIARPIIETILFDNDKAAYEIFLESRKTEVKDFIINSIIKK